jgi:hypothetical protein
VTQGGTVLGVPKHVFDLGAVPVPVLDGGRFGRGRHIQVGEDEQVAIDRVGVSQLIQRQDTLVEGAGCGAAAPGGRS